MARVAIASCKDLPDWELDDQPFFQTLTEYGVEYEILPWDSAVDWSQYEACLIRTTWDYQERFEEFTQWLDNVSQQTTLLNSKAVMLWNSHKSYLKDLETAGITIAPSHWLMHGVEYDARSIMQQHGWTEGFIKPLIGANARECCRFAMTAEGISEAQSHIDRLTPNEDLVMQPYLKSVEEFGETSGIFFAGEFSHGTRKVPVKGDFRVQDDYGAKDYPYQLNDQELKLAKQALDWVNEKFGSLLYARLDFLHGEQGEVYLNEMELIEPSLFFRHGGQQSCKLLTEKLLQRLSN
ncbi:RimK family alpha-L-glutamate ligase [Kangiella sp. HZ709]|uniref:ATP-grasp domain-containing protein n=1 Tax=Kangiella sp. HZ709 TaxID=2666328 RepID=UPI0012B0B974|nr:hypothetical protein [Kangiella sp. HZ709]MRX27878.1 hypothetical protein [Kangiella sp. HZ709]